jgi:hypothetical protein
MMRLLVLLLAALHVAAASVPCPPRAGAEDDRAVLAAHAERAVHATHHAPQGEAARHGGRADDLRAPCPCGCDEAAAGGLAAARLGPLGLPHAPCAEWPAGAAAPRAACTSHASALLPLPDPVPRAA